MVRRLPVLQNEAAEALRPPWHWVLIGAGLIPLIWTPLALAVLYAIGRLADASATQAPAVTGVSLLLAYALASGLGGFVLGRFGAPATVREALLAGICASVGLACLTLLTGYLEADAALVAGSVMTAVALLASWFGARVGLSGRR